MKRLSVLLCLALVWLVGAPAFASEPVVTVTATNWAFTPRIITLHVGQKVKLVFRSSDGIHGIAIPEIGVHDVVNIGTDPTIVEVTPKHLGTFVAHCAVYCGMGHEKMILTVKVIK